MCRKRPRRYQIKDDELDNHNVNWTGAMTVCIGGDNIHTGDLLIFTLTNEECVEKFRTEGKSLLIVNVKYK